MFDALFTFLRDWYEAPVSTPIPQNVPRLGEHEEREVREAVASGFVSSVGERVGRFEKGIAEYVHVRHAVATVNGTAALQTALRLVGVRRDEEVITQPLTFVATANAIAYLHAQPVFIDVDAETLGLAPEALEQFLHEHADRRDDGVWNRATGRRLAAVLPVHTHGRPCCIDAIIEIADRWGLPVIEDAAEALGSMRNNKHCGTFGRVGIYSFNGNKVITTGGGGMIMTNDSDLAARARHLTTTAKVPHPWQSEHDELGYNFRMPNLNAALGCAQLERLESLLSERRQLSAAYEQFFANCDWATWLPEPADCGWNGWLNAILVHDRETRDRLVEAGHAAGIALRPAWRLVSELPMYRDAFAGPLPKAQDLANRLVTLPSSPR